MVTLRLNSGHIVSTKKNPESALPANKESLRLRKGARQQSPTGTDSCSAMLANSSVY